MLWDCRGLLCLLQAEEVDEDWVEHCDRLGLSLNLDKRWWCRQIVEYAGFQYDTLHGLLLILPDKLVKLMGCLSGHARSRLCRSYTIWSASGTCACWQRRSCASSGCFRRAKTTVPSRCPYGAMMDLTDELKAVITKHHAAGRPLWPLVPSTRCRVAFA